MPKKDKVEKCGGRPLKAALSGHERTELPPFRGAIPGLLRALWEGSGERRKSRDWVAGALGFEPRITGPKPVALPLGHAPIASHFRRRRNGHGAHSTYTYTYGGYIWWSQQASERPPTSIGRPGQRGSRALAHGAFPCGPRPTRLYTGTSTRRSVAQPGSAPASGAGGREFESPHSDHRQRQASDGRESANPLR